MVFPVDFDSARNQRKDAQEHSFEQSPIIDWNDSSTAPHSAPKSVKSDELRAKLETLRSKLQGHSSSDCERASAKASTTANPMRTGEFSLESTVEMQHQTEPKADESQTKNADESVTLYETPISLHATQGVDSSGSDTNVHAIHASRQNNKKEIYGSFPQSGGHIPVAPEVKFSNSFSPGALAVSQDDDDFGGFVEAIQLRSAHDKSDIPFHGADNLEFGHTDFRSSGKFNEPHGAFLTTKHREPNFGAADLFSTTIDSQYGASQHHANTNALAAAGVMTPLSDGPSLKAESSSSRDMNAWLGRGHDPFLLNSVKSGHHTQVQSHTQDSHSAKWTQVPFERRDEIAHSPVENHNSHNSYGYGQTQSLSHQGLPPFSPVRPQPPSSGFIGSHAHPTGESSLKMDTTRPDIFTGIGSVQQHPLYGTGKGANGMQQHPTSVKGMSGVGMSGMQQNLSNSMGMETGIARQHHVPGMFTGRPQQYPAPGMGNDMGQRSTHNVGMVNSGQNIHMQSLSHHDSRDLATKSSHDFGNFESGKPDAFRDLLADLHTKPK
jgi:hypothetical protein